MAEPRVQRRLAAILAADVAGYSRLMGEDEAGTLDALKARRRDVLVPLVARHHGRVVKLMGDGVLVEFASAVDAVECAVGLQDGFAAANHGVPEARRIMLRIGINLGDVIVEGSDLYGDGVNLAARLQSLAEPGGISVSRNVHDQVRRKLDLGFDELGPQTLKNIAEPVHVYRVRKRPSAQEEHGGQRPESPALPGKPSIAVLPFANMSGDPEQEYFADGMAEDIITALSRFSALFVIARNSSFTYKGRAVDVKQVGRELGVRYVLEGSVRKAGNRVRISGQLVDTATGGHLWADRFDRGLEDIFELQDQVTASVVGAIAPKLEQAEIERSRRKPTDSLDAYDYYLRGLTALRLWTLQGNNEALSMFTRAIELDPRFASAYGMSARCYVQRKMSGWMTDRAQEAARTAELARRAAELGKDDADALCTAGFGLAFVVGDLDGGSALIDRALVLNPNSALAWYFSGWVNVWLGQPEVAIERATRALRLSPHDPHLVNMQSAIAHAHFIAGRHADALSWAKIALRERPGHPSSMRILAASSAITGLDDQAKKAMARLRELDPALRISNLHHIGPLRRPEDFASLVEGLRKAGLPE